MIPEDEILLLCELEALVVHPGYEIAGTATSVDIALSRMSEGLSPDLALLGLNLNAASREPVADRLVSAGVAVIFVSGYGASGLGERFKDAEVLQKPYDDADLAEALARTLSLKARIREWPSTRRDCRPGSPQP